MKQQVTLYWQVLKEKCQKRRKIGKEEHRKDESWGREALLKLSLILSKLLMRNSILYTTSMGKCKEMGDF